jgi:hypothetical protein
VGGELLEQQGAWLCLVWTCRVSGSVHSLTQWRSLRRRWARHLGQIGGEVECACFVFGDSGWVGAVRT